MRVKLIRLLALVLAMVFLLASCGGDTPVDTGTTDGEQGGEPGGEQGDQGTEQPPANDKPIDWYVKMFTYNLAFWDPTDSDIEYANQTAEDYTTEKRQARLKALVNYYEPDIIALQEVNYRWWPYLVSNEDSLLNSGEWQYTGNKSAFGSMNGRGKVENELYNLLFWNTEKFELVEEGHFWLTANKRKLGNNNANRERMCTYAILKNKETGNETVYASTHLRTTGEGGAAENLEEAKYLVKWLTEAAEGRPIVMGGDFNMSPYGSASGTYTYLTAQAKFYDLKRKAKTMLNVSMSTMRVYGQNSNYATGNNAIDFIFYRGDIQGYKYNVLCDTVDDNDNYKVYPGTSGVGKYYDISDHLGVYAEFKELPPE